MIFGIILHVPTRDLKDTPAVGYMYSAVQLSSLHFAAMSEGLAVHTNGLLSGFIEKAFQLIKRYQETQCEDPVIRFQQPDQLKKTFPVTIDTEKWTSLTELLDVCDKLLQYSVKTGHPYFLNQLYGGTDPIGLVAAFLIESLNTNVYTFDVGPVLTLIEREVLAKLSEKVGYDSNCFDGTFCPGGSIANMYGVHLARYHKDKSVKQEGMFGAKRQIIFTSQESHYSVMKAASFLGFGVKSVRTVETDSYGSMIPSSLEQLIVDVLNEGLDPLMVWATSGTTVLGAFDPIDKIADICEKYNLWLHVDACLGGAALLSRQHKHLLNGINRADSFVWNWHKILGAPFQTSAFLTKHRGLLNECNCANAEYLFQQDKHYDTQYDSGDSSIQCSRKPDCLKIWLMWKARGDQGLEALVNKAYGNAKYLWDCLKHSNYFIMVNDKPQGTTVCFWIVPKCLQQCNRDELFWQNLSKVAPKLKLAMVQSGKLMINHQSLPAKGKSNFFRVTITCHPILQSGDVEKLVKQMQIIADTIETV